MIAMVLELIHHMAKNWQIWFQKFLYRRQKAKPSGFGGRKRRQDIFIDQLTPEHQVYGGAWMIFQVFVQGLQLLLQILQVVISPGWDDTQLQTVGGTQWVTSSGWLAQAANFVATFSPGLFRAALVPITDAPLAVKPTRCSFLSPQESNKERTRLKRSWASKPGMSL